jgi:hypothetical protein
VQTFHVDSLDPADAVGAAKRARKISSSATFFKAGHCLNRTLVCVVKSGTVSSTIKALEPVELSARSKKQPGLRKLLPTNQDSLRVYKEVRFVSTPARGVLRMRLNVGAGKKTNSFISLLRVVLVSISSSKRFASGAKRGSKLSTWSASFCCSIQTGILTSIRQQHSRHAGFARPRRFIIGLCSEA